MRFPDPAEKPRGLQGSLLVALPSLKDPNFRRSVLYLSKHAQAEGAFGLVLNRPLGKNAADLLPKHPRHHLLERIPVYLGGPVGHDQLGFVEVGWNESDQKFFLETNLSLDDAEARMSRSPESVRAFVGYSGWSAGQLEEELAQKAWTLAEPQPMAADPHAQAKMWFNIMCTLGPIYKLLAVAPDDPSLN